MTSIYIISFDIKGAINDLSLKFVFFYIYSRFERNFDFVLSLSYFPFCNFIFILLFLLISLPILNSLCFIWFSVSGEFGLNPFSFIDTLMLMFSGAGSAAHI